MKSKGNAVLEVLGYTVDSATAKRLFSYVYTFMLYNDTGSFLEMLDFRTNLLEINLPSEDYYVFRFMLQKMLDRHPSMLLSLNPLSDFVAA